MTTQPQFISVLLVDDDSVDREMVRRLLDRSELSYRVTEAITVDEGLEAYRKDNFDIILLDYRMPKRNGDEMIIEVRTQMTNSRSAIIVLSTSDEEKLAKECIKAGAQDVIVKSELTSQRIRAAINNAQLRFELEEQQKARYLEAKANAEKDLLTGLPNRFVFDETLQRAVTRSAEHGEQLALVLFDIDNFKNINDIHGHDIADQVLIEVANRVVKFLKHGEMLSRLHGDEFGILISDLKDIYNLSLLAKQIILINKEVDIKDDLTIKLNISIGIALNPKSCIDHKELVKCANIALYRAKKQQGSQYHFFYPEMKDKLVRRYEIEKKLGSAVSNNDLILLFQPIIDMNSKELCGFEALLRFNNNFTLQSFPDEFIPIAEEIGAIEEIGKWVIERAIMQLADWNKRFSKALTMSINLSAIQIESDCLCESIKNSLQKYELAPSLLEFEITETVMFNCTKGFITKIEDIRALGCKIALDDFGTGFSSISHLMDLPISTVKLDKSIMPNERDSSKKKLLLEALILMINKLGLEMVAEGIEDLSHLKLIESFNVDRAQGYYFMKPAAKKAIESTYFQR